MMILTEAERTRMGQIDPLLAEAISQRPGPPSGDGGILETRRLRAEHLAKLRHLYPIPGPIPEEVTEIEHFVEAEDGYQIPIKVYKRSGGTSEPSPIIVMMHEGGWSMGDLTDEDLNCRMFARDLGAVCINVDYRLAPEHPWPKCVEDCYDVLHWVLNDGISGSVLSPGDPFEGFIVGGASAGGNLAAVMCQLARDRDMSPPLTGQYLCVPALMWNDTVPERWQSDYRSFNESQDPVLKDLKGAVVNLAGPGSTDPRFSPLLHHNLKGLPPCYLQIAGLDLLRDEALIWEQALRENGTKTRQEVYDGYGHMFWTNWPELQRSKEFVQDTLAGMKWLLSTVRNA